MPETPESWVMAEPTRVIAGDSWTWTRSGDAYPASDGWTLTYYLSLGADAPETIESTASGADFHVTVPATTTKDWPAGAWKWAARVAKAGEVHTVGTGDLQVQPDLIAAVDRRTHAEKALAAIELALAASSGDMIIEYEIDGVKCKKDRGAAMRERDKLRIEVALQRRRPLLSRITLGGFR